MDEALVINTFTDGSQRVWCAPNGVKCSMADPAYTHRPGDYALCPCCGHQGTHRVGPGLPVPRCLGGPENAVQSVGS